MAHDHFEPHVNGRFAAVVAALATLMGMAGCTARPQDCARPDVQCAGLVTDFGSVEEGISREAWMALGDARSAGLVDRVDFIETVDTRDREANIASFAGSGYDVIITVGGGITEETVVVAERYPALYFVGIQQSPEQNVLPTNYVTLVFHEEQSGFLAGAAAGLITQSGRVAAVCEVEFIESIWRTCEGFRRGAVYANPAVEVDVSYRSGPEELLFRDLDWGAEAAALSVDRGADVLFAIGEETASAAMKAAAVRGALVIGAEFDRFAQLPELGAALVTSAVLDVRGGLLAILQEAVEGRLRGEQHWGAVGLAPFHDFASQLPPEVLIRLAAISDDLQAGVIRVDTGP